MSEVGSRTCPRPALVIPALVNEFPKTLNEGNPPLTCTTPLTCEVIPAWDFLAGLLLGPLLVSEVGILTECRPAHDTNLGRHYPAPFINHTRQSILLCS
jgi:hypothetical protein